MSSIVLLVLLCLSMHACNARLLGFVPRESGCRAYHSIEDVGNVLRCSESSRPTISVEWQTKQVEVKVDAETLLTLESIPKDDLLRKQGHFHGPTSGHDIFTVSSGIDQKKSIKMKKKKMTNLAKLDFVTLDITGKNCLTWVVDAKIHLEAGDLGDTIKEGNIMSSQDRVKATGSLECIEK